MQPPALRPVRLIALAALALAAACARDATSPAAPPAPRFASQPATGQYLVLLRGGGAHADFESRVAAAGGTVRVRHAGAGIAVVSGLTELRAASLKKSRDVADVQPDVRVQLDTRSRVAAALTGLPVARSQASPATALGFGFQWNMTAMGAPAAWAAGRLGSPDVTVAILDSGIDYEAFDLAGLVDLSRSKSFVAGDDTTFLPLFPGKNAIADFNGHGTNVATIVSSKALVFAGVTSRTTLIGVKVIGANGSGSLGGILAGILWAADHGADVANLSLGALVDRQHGGGSLAGVVNPVLAYAQRKGMLLVVSAGNESLDLDHDGPLLNEFCDAPLVMCVSAVGPLTATGSPDVPAFYTDFGRSAISVAAYGGNAQADSTDWPWGRDNISWVWSLCSRTLLVVDSTGVKTPCAGGLRLLAAIGTSQAAPHVTGLAAQLVAQLGHGNAALIKARIEQTAADLGQRGVDPFYGKGRIDLRRALGLP